MLTSAHLAATSGKQCLGWFNIKHFRSEVSPPNIFILVERQRWEEMDFFFL